MSSQSLLMFPGIKCHRQTGKKPLHVYLDWISSSHSLFFFFPPSGHYQGGNKNLHALTEPVLEIMGSENGGKSFLNLTHFIWLGRSVRLSCFVICHRDDIRAQFYWNFSRTQASTGSTIVKSFIKRHKAPAIAFVQLLPRQVRCIRVNNIVKSLFHEKSLKNHNMEASSCQSEAEHCFHFSTSLDALTECFSCSFWFRF